MTVEFVFQQKLEKIRQTLELCWNDKTSYSGEFNSSKGQCFVSTLVAFDLLKQYNPLIVKGTFFNARYFSHYWLEIDGKIVDFTADQFVHRELPPVVFASYSEMPRYKAGKKVLSTKSYKYSSAFKRYKLLKERVGRYI